MIKYSFIVPVYNTEKYLSKCLDSLVNQTFKDFEIVIVNDGSYDNSLNIINEYANNYSNITVINQENLGLSMARNNGVKACNGNYILFIDSDDYVELDLLEKIDSEVSDVDVLRYQIITEDMDGSNKIYHKETPFDSINGKQAFMFLSNYYFVEPACCYVYNRNYFISNDFYFEKGVYHEDYGLIPYVIYKALKVKSIDYLGYHYVRRDDSITNNSDYNKTVKKAFDTLTLYKKLREYSDNFNSKNNKDDYYLSYVTNAVITKAKTLKGNDKKLYVSTLKSLRVVNGVLTNTFTRKIKKMMMKLNLNLYINLMVK